MLVHLPLGEPDPVERLRQGTLESMRGPLGARVLRCSVHFDATGVPGAVFARGMGEEFEHRTGRPATDRPG
ncbi:hypothetical protein [Arthrobacter sp. SX1312]|uniref:hypothetical protein n=1 Tax=Arthrobacter sp. SX1312 TaxID=2058896 RepID=UPI002157468E|nr:hypothetical protein [Arthrobacter sp. SX1312]